MRETISDCHLVDKRISVGQNVRRMSLKTRKQSGAHDVYVQSSSGIVMKESCRDDLQKLMRKTLTTNEQSKRQRETHAKRKMSPRVDYQMNNGSDLQIANGVLGDFEYNEITQYRNIESGVLDDFEYNKITQCRNIESGSTSLFQTSLDRGPFQVADETKQDALSQQFGKSYQKKCRKKRTKRFDLDDVPVESHKLKEPVLCKHCGARIFQYERKGFRCSNGEIMLKMNDAPDELFGLFVSLSDEARKFKNLKDVPDLVKQEIHIRCDPGLDQRVYNAPSASQVAALWVDEDLSAGERIHDIVVSAHSGDNYRIHYYFGCYDPLQYPLLFPYGDAGWHQGIRRIDKRRPTTNYVVDGPINVNQIDSVAELIAQETAVLEEKKRSSVSCREYYCYKLQIRPLQNSLLLHAGRLLQQYVVDMYVKVETARLDYFRNKQTEIRTDLYQGIIDSVEMGRTRGYDAGRRIILPASFTGGPRNMRKRYIDAMSLVQRFGKPDIFLTMTCNPNWSEIKEQLGDNDLAQDRPDLVSCVFRAKIEALKDDLIKKEIFGAVAAYVYVIEFQKRGLPHAHFLLILQGDSKLVSPDRYDQIVTAEIPDRDEHLHLYSLVAKHMMHGPCGVLNPKNVCMKSNGKCRSHYPKTFCSETQNGDDSYPKYRRRNNNRTVRVRGHDLDNKWVVPYNPYLLAKFDCHINVEICCTIKAVKYLYKYVYKGHDRVCFSVTVASTSNVINEIDIFQSARWISPPEATWRIFGFVLSEMHPHVVSLQLHLPDSQLITFCENDDLSMMVNDDMMKRTMLTEFFRMNSIDAKAKTLLYRQFPEHFVWNKRDKIWTHRKKFGVIGRIVTASPMEGERYYLRLLLNHVVASESFKHLKTVNGVLAPSFREAALLYGLLNGDNNYELCLKEASTYEMPFALRRLFATILAYCSP